MSVGHARKEDAPNLSAADLTLAFKYESSDGKNVVVKVRPARLSFAQPLPHLTPLPLP